MIKSSTRSGWGVWWGTACSLEVGQPQPGFCTVNLGLSFGNSLFSRMAENNTLGFIMAWVSNSELKANHLS